MEAQFHSAHMQRSATRMVMLVLDLERERKQFLQEKRHSGKLKKMLSRLKEDAATGNAAAVHLIQSHLQSKANAVQFK